MAGSGIAVRLHEFRQSQDSRERDGPNMSTMRTFRVGRDVHGLYPGQLGRVHRVHSKDYGSGSIRQRFPSLTEPLQPPTPGCENYQQSFDLRTLRALNLLRHSPEVLEQRPPLTAYQEQFGLLFPK